MGVRASRLTRAIEADILRQSEVRARCQRRNIALIVDAPKILRRETPNLPKVADHGIK